MTEGRHAQPPTYHRAVSLADARRHLGRRGACVYAGGTDLLVALRAGAPWVAGVRHLVDIKGLDALRGIARVGDAIRIGSLVTGAELATSALVRRVAPVLCEAAALAAAPWVRARGTVGGNLMTPHPAGDLATALLAMGGTAEFVTPAGLRRSIAIQALLAGHARIPRGAVMTGVRAPVAPSSAYQRVGRRLAFTRAVIAVGVVRHGAQLRVAAAGLGARPVLFAEGGTVPGEDGALVDGLVRRAIGRLRPARGTGRA